MADVKISELPTGAASDADEMVIVDGAATKKINLSALSAYLRAAGWDVTGTVTADGLSVDGTTVSPVSISSTNSGNQIKFSSSSTAVSGEWYVGVSGDPSDDFIIYQGSAGAGNIITYTEGKKRQSIANNGDISFYEDTGTTAKFFWDASAERLGIGTSSPTDTLNISSSANQIGLDTGDQSTYGTLDVGHFSNGAFIGTQAGSNAASNILRLGTSGTERLRIDSSGYFHLGGDFTTALNGFGGENVSKAFFSGGSSQYVAINTASTNSALYLSKSSSASAGAALINFADSGTTVGSIGTSGSALNFMGGAGNDGLQVGPSGGEPYVIPVNNNAIVDAQGSIGLSNYRWKDLYLSGGVYLGGTGAANKLDDYEEGTFTPTLSGTGISGTGTYTKIGNIVHYDIQLSSNSGISGHTGYITGLPFTSVSGEYPSNGHISRLYGVTLSNKNYMLRAYNYELSIMYIGGDNAVQGFSQTSSTVRIGISATIQTS